MASIIEQIASDLNVSSASVSRALNDRPGVSRELRERILARARELNYTPGITARGLATSRTFSVGFFVRQKPGLSTQSDPYYGEMLHGAEQVCAETDYHLTIATLTDAMLAEPRAFRFVRERRIDGMMLAGPDIPNEFILTMLQSGLPVVLIDNRLEYSPVNCVNSDDEQGAYQAACHLIKSGHHSIGIISGPEHWPSNMRRVKGYHHALQDSGLPLQIVHVSRTTIESGEEAYRTLIARYPSLTGICAVNDSMAIGAIRQAQKDGKHIPDDLSVVGFDGIDWAALNHPPLTTVNVPKRQMGKEAARRLLSLLDDPDSAPVEITVSVQFVQRESSRPA
ncbi:MAG TPA: LacI family DNA-binding transcriptional regulator [Spirillospora sp.]|nr:LacI family DNA-binding transcriptional regulator [Spirillospora sp.]